MCSKKRGQTNEGILMEAHLSGRHRDTIEKIFRPGNHNVEWREIVSLLETIGTVTHEHNGKLKVAVGPETRCFPHLAVRTPTFRSWSMCGEC